MAFVHKAVIALYEAQSGLIRTLRETSCDSMVETWDDVHGARDHRGES
jgi:hypothetical protein